MYKGHLHGWDSSVMFGYPSKPCVDWDVGAVSFLLNEAKIVGGPFAV